MLDNLRWIEEAQKYRMVVGSQARILYADHAGRRLLAAAFNAAIADGRLLVWGYPRVAFTDRDLLPGTLTTKDGAEFGQLAQVASFRGTKIVVRRADGARSARSGPRAAAGVTLRSEELLVC